MRKLSVFNFLTLNGYFEGANHDISWHKHEEEEAKFSEEMLGQGNLLLFGRVTYDLMAGYWPTPSVIENDPIIADAMNKAEKIVFSRTLKKAEWNNTRVIGEHIIDEIKKLKQTPGKNLTILGSGNIITQFAEHGLIDEYQLMIAPIAIGEGSTLFKGIKDKLNLKLASTRTFKNGNVLLIYEPVRQPPKTLSEL